MRKVEHNKILKFFIMYKRWIKKIITFADIEIEKCKLVIVKILFCYKMQISKKYRYLTWFLQFKKICKYFIGFKDDNHKMKPLRIILSKTSANVKSYYGETKWTYLFIEDDELLEKDNKELYCKPVE